jgi:RimJ/RimL family protein N-acetyltransferase
VLPSLELPAQVMAAPVALRHFAPADAPSVQTLADDWEVAKTTAALPHPYRPGMAESWIAGHEDARRSGGEFPYAITRASDGTLVGALGMRPHANEHGNFGYWIGRAHWGAGYATAATRAAIALLFARTDLDLLWAVHLAGNEGSARVLDKCGMSVLRAETRLHRGQMRELLVRGITRDEWESLRS